MESMEMNKKQGKLRLPRHLFRKHSQKKQSARLGVLRLSSLDLDQPSHLDRIHG